jgi:hypothetical protein
MIDIILFLFIRRSQSVLMNVECKKMVLFTIRIFDVVKFITLSPLSITFLSKHSFPIVVLKISSLPIFATKFPAVKLFTIRELLKSHDSVSFSVGSHSVTICGRLTI